MQGKSLITITRHLLGVGWSSWQQNHAAYSSVTTRLMLDGVEVRSELKNTHHLVGLLCIQK